MQRWRINNPPAFLLRCMLHAPALGGVLFVLGAGTVMYVPGFSVYGLSQLPMLFLTGLLISPLAAILGVILGLLPGMTGGCILLLMSHFRAPTTLEFVVAAALSAAPIGLLWGMSQDPLDQYYPLIFAGIGAVCALVLQAGARRKGIIVPSLPTLATTASAPQAT
jgi:hypothetical protein